MDRSDDIRRVTVTNDELGQRGAVLIHVARPPVAILGSERLDGRDLVASFVPGASQCYRSAGSKLMMSIVLVTKSPNPASPSVPRPSAPRLAPG